MLLGMQYLKEKNAGLSRMTPQDVENFTVNTLTIGMGLEAKVVEEVQVEPVDT